MLPSGVELSRTYGGDAAAAVTAVTGRRGLLACLAVVAALAGCAARPPASDSPPLQEQPGRVVRVGDFGYGIVPDADPGTRYAPEAMSSEFEQDGLRVLFAGVLTTPPPGVRLWGTPLRLTSIRRAP